MKGRIPHAGPVADRLSATRRRSLAVLSGAVVGQGALVVVSPLITRLYTPGQLGALAVFTSLAAVLGVLALQRLDAVILLPRGRAGAVAAAWNAVTCLALVSTVIAVVGLVAGAWLAGVLNTPQLHEFWWLLSLTVALIGLAQVAATWMARTGNYRGLAYRAAAQGGGQALCQVLNGVLGASTGGLLSSLGFGRLMALGGMLGREGIARQPRPRWRLMKAVLRRHRRFPLVASWSGVLNSLGQQAPLVLVSALYGQVAVGLLALALRVLAAPAAVVGQAVAKVFQGEASAITRERTGGLLAHSVAVTRQLLVLGAVPALLVLAAGPDMFSFVFGDDWKEAGEYARYLAIAYLLQFATSPVSQILLLTERQVVQLAWDAGRLVLTCGLPLTVWSAGGSVYSGVLALGAAQALSYGALWGLCLHAALIHDRASDVSARVMNREP